DDALDVLVERLHRIADRAGFGQKPASALQGLGRHRLSVQTLHHVSQLVNPNLDPPDRLHQSTSDLIIAAYPDGQIARFLALGRAAGAAPPGRTVSPPDGARRGPACRMHVLTWACKPFGGALQDVETVEFDAPTAWRLVDGNLRG